LTDKIVKPEVASNTPQSQEELEVENTRMATARLTAPVIVEFCKQWHSDTIEEAIKSNWSAKEDFLKNIEDYIEYFTENELHALLKDIFADANLPSIKDDFFGRLEIYKSKLSPLHFADCYLCATFIGASRFDNLIHILEILEKLSVSDQEQYKQLILIQLSSIAKTFANGIQILEYLEIISNLIPQDKLGLLIRNTLKEKNTSHSFLNDPQSTLSLLSTDDQKAVIQEVVKHMDIPQNSFDYDTNHLRMNRKGGGLALLNIADPIACRFIKHYAYFLNLFNENELAEIFGIANQVPELGINFFDEVEVPLARMGEMTFILAAKGTLQKHPNACMAFFKKQEIIKRKLSDDGLFDILLEIAQETIYQAVLFKWEFDDLASLSTNLSPKDQEGTIKLYLENHFNPLFEFLVLQMNDEGSLNRAKQFLYIEDPEYITKNILGLFEMVLICAENKTIENITTKLSIEHGIDISQEGVIDENRELVHRITREEQNIMIGMIHNICSPGLVETYIANNQDDNVSFLVNEIVYGE